MKISENSPRMINSISELHRLLDLPKPHHPLLSIINLSTQKSYEKLNAAPVVYNFYSVCIKKDFTGKIKYGQQYYDFDEGVMTFFAPGQVTTTELSEDFGLTGFWLVFQPDFIHRYELSKKIKDYGFFSYAINEALHLSDKEEKMMEKIMSNIQREYLTNIDKFSQDVMVSHLDLLLNYSNRFYNRQFITRKNPSSNLLVKFEELLNEYFNLYASEKGLPSVNYFSDKLFISANYLSDMLKNLTGQSTLNHIHNKAIEIAKHNLTTTQLSVSEISFQLGFKYPQSFNKLFKSKTNLSPLEYKQSFN